MSSRLCRRRTVRIRQRIQGACKCRLLLWRNAHGPGWPARKGGEAHAPCKLAPRQGTGRWGSRQFDRRRLRRHPPAPQCGLDSADLKRATTTKKATNDMKKSKTAPKETKGADSPARLIDARIKKLG